MTDPTPYQSWAAAEKKDTPPLTDEQLEEMFEWSTRYGSSNCWTGHAGTGAAMVRRLLRERVELVRRLDKQG